MQESRVILKRIAHVHYSHVDVDKTRQFLRDFGLTEVARVGDQYYWKGYGDLPFIYVLEKATEGKALFKGVAFEAESKEELEKAAGLKGASPIQQLDSPGGGLGVTIADPYGIPFRVIWGQELVGPCEPRNATTKAANRGIGEVEKKARPPGVFQRFDRTATVQVHKLGHYVINVPNYTTAAAFYINNFNFTPSDVLTLGPSGPEIGAFLHLDRGKEWVDHHTLFLQTSADPCSTTATIHHAAFEVFDLDQQFLAHKNLVNKGYELAWGVGRHILGSQIFDYWHQSGDGFNVEHYADGDLVNDDTPVGRHPVQPGIPLEEHLSIWGPNFEPAFFRTSETVLVR